MDVLVACEYSGIVRDAFIAKGHNAISCDILDTESPGPHIKGDIFSVNQHFDLMIAHPPCTYLCVTGNKWFVDNPDRWLKRYEAMLFVRKLMRANVEKIAIENPVGVISTWIRPPDQYIQPYEFGHEDSKKTGLWLKNLPKLVPTNIVEPVWILGKNGKRSSKTHYNIKNPLLRAKTYQGIADAMADQWG